MKITGSDIQEKAGWTDETMLKLVTQFFDEHTVYAEAFLAYLNEIADAEASVDEPKTVCCPFCKEGTITELGTWLTKSEEDEYNTATLTEWQCDGPCGGRSFWV